MEIDPLFNTSPGESHQDHPTVASPTGATADAGRSLAPPVDLALEVALDATSDQFTRMTSSNPWDYARAVVAALREAGMIRDAE